jgi:hypothetical protein
LLDVMRWNLFPVVCAALNLFSVELEEDRRTMLIKHLPSGVVQVLAGDVSHVDGSTSHPYFHESIALVVLHIVVIVAYKKSVGNNIRNVWVSSLTVNEAHEAQGQADDDAEEGPHVDQVVLYVGWLLSLLLGPSRKVCRGKER